MTELFPLKPAGDRPAARERDPRLVGIGEDEADEVFSALSSATARDVLETLYEESCTASDVAERVDTSLQNATYHVNKLRDAGLVEVAETWYSAQGREMKVYAPTSGPLVVYAGAREAADDRSLTTALSRLFGAVAVVALLGVLVNAAAAGLARRSSAGAGPMVSAASRPKPQTVGAPETSHSQTGLAGSALHALQGLLDAVVGLVASPGGVTFVLGTALVGTLFAVWYTRRYRRDTVRVA